MPWVSIGLTNSGVVTMAAGLAYLLDLPTFLVVHLPIVLLGAAIGVWLFYVQNQFEQT